MRIAYLVGTDSWGGLEMNQAKNALWMKERGHQILVLGRENSKLETFCSNHQLDFEAIEPHKKYYDFKHAKQLNALLTKHQIDHLIIRDVRDMSIAVAAKYRSKKHPFKVHYFMEMQLGVKKTNPLHTLRFKLLDTWSCPLNWLKQQVETMTKMPKDRIVMIPSALDVTPFQTSLSKSEARHLLDLPEHKIIIGLAGRFDPQKGQLLLLDALSKLENKEVGVLFLGEPTAHEGADYHQQMLQTIATNGLEDRVFVRPFRSDIEVFYKAIDAFVMASKAETVGMVTLEAMASGTPVIGSNAGGTIEILQNGKLGYLFETLNANSLAEKITLFIQQPNHFSSKELQKGVAKFSHHLVFDKVEKQLQQF